MSKKIARLTSTLGGSNRPRRRRRVRPCVARDAARIFKRILIIVVLVLLVLGWIFFR